MIKAIIFDLGRVILDFDWMIACDNLSKYAGISGKEIKKIVFDGGLEFELERGECTPEEFHERVVDATGADVSYEDFVRLWGEIFSPNPPVMEIVRKLKGKYRLLLLSDTNDIHFRYGVSTFKEPMMMDGFVLSHKVGVLKPDSKLYMEAVKAAGCRPEECVYIDDLERNVEAAAELGINTILYTIGKTDLRKELEKFGVRF